MAELRHHADERASKCTSRVTVRPHVDIFTSQITDHVGGHCVTCSGVSGRCGACGKDTHTSLDKTVVLKYMRPTYGGPLQPTLIDRWLYGLDTPDFD